MKAKHFLFLGAVAFFALGLFLLAVVQAQQSSPAVTPATPVVVRPQWEPPRWPVEFTEYNDPLQPGVKVTIMTVVVPEAKKILVYQIDRAEVKLLSARTMEYDLELPDFNTGSPTPEDLRIEVERLKRGN